MLENQPRIEIRVTRSVNRDAKIKLMYIKNFLSRKKDQLKRMIKDELDKKLTDWAKTILKKT